MIKALLKKALSAMALLCAVPISAQDVTATWDFQHAFAKSEISIQKTTGQVKSDVSDVELFVDATNGKLQSRGSDAQFNSGTIIRIPVKSTRDYVSVVSYPGYHNYTVGGKDADADSVAHKATTAEVKNGYVEVVGTGSSYLYRIHATFVSVIQEKGIFDTNFRDWTEVDRKANNETPSVYNLKTKYSHENFTMTLCGVGAYPNGTNSKFSDITGFIESAKYTNEVKTQEPYAVTSALASVSKITFHQMATGGNRGWAVACRTAGTEKWDTLYYQSIAKSNGEDVSIDVNRQNVEIKFFPFNISQNAYMSELHIYGMVDLSKSPSLATFTANGKTYQAADVFDEDSQGNYVTTVEVSKKDQMIDSSNEISASADNGTIGKIEYKEIKSDLNGGKPNCDVTIPIYLDNDTANYVISFVWKPDYVVNYYNTDGKLIDKKVVEKNAAIGTLNDGSKVTVPQGSKFRGWLFKVNGDEKASASTTVDDPVLNLYALVTDIEGDGAKERNVYDFKNKFFYVEDHEAFVPNSAYSYNGAQHGLNIKQGSVTLTVGGNATIIVEACKYSKSSMTLKDEDGKVYGTVDIPETDGEKVCLQYTGDARKLTLDFPDGEVYIHSLTIMNTGDKELGDNAKYYVVEPGNSDSFLNILDYLSAKFSVPGSINYGQFAIYLPNGVYDLGQKVNTKIPMHGLSIIGESRDSTIIVSSPDISKEGLGSADLFYNGMSYLYMQDLTLKNGLDYYGAGAAGRAAVIQDRGDKTIFKNVKMLSYQDTYYSQNNNLNCVFDSCDIHGTVDFICGGGNVRFQNCQITLEKRNVNGTGGRTITAPTTAKDGIGYVFDGCKIVDLSEGKGNWNYGRTWQNEPKAIFLNTTLDSVAEKTIVPSRWTEKGMNNKDPKLFGEYGTVNEKGENITPASNIIKSYGGSFETILKASDISEEYSFENMTKGWALPQTFLPCYVKNLKINGNELTWEDSCVTGYSSYNTGVYLVSKNGKFYEITFEPKIEISGDGLWSVRASGLALGFGPASSISISTGVENVNTNTEKPVKTEYYNIAGFKVARPSNGVYIAKKIYSDGKVKASKVLVK